MLSLPSNDVVHAAGIFHRDIKPANILLTRREDGALRAKLSDFGLGAAQDPEFLKSISDSRVSGCVGTWDDIATEVRHGRPASAQSDLYSLGLTLYQIVVGNLDRPLTGDWESQVPTDVLRENLGKHVCQDPATRCPAGPSWLALCGIMDLGCIRERWNNTARNNRCGARRFRHAAVLTSVVALLLLAVSAVALYQWREAARPRAHSRTRLAVIGTGRATRGTCEATVGIGAIARGSREPAIGVGVTSRDVLVHKQRVEFLFAGIAAVGVPRERLFQSFVELGRGGEIQLIRGSLGARFKLGELA